MKTDCRTCAYGAECFERELIGENDNCETYTPEPTMNVMAVPNPNAYVFRGKQGKEAIAEAKYIIIGTEDGWLECRNNKAYEEYLQAKAITEEYEFVKAIKLEAYREFAKELNEKIDFYRRNYDLDYGMLIDFFENDIKEIVRYKEEE